MTRRTARPAPELAPLLDSWQLSLEAEHKSPATVKTYLTSARQYLTWCASTGRPGTLDRRGAAAFTAHLLAGGAEPATANVRHRALRRLGAWLAEEGECDASPLMGMAPPKLDRKTVPKLTDDELRALIAACAGNRLCDRRDEAIVRLASEAMCRAEELLALEVDDVDLRRGIAVIRRGKGGKARIVPFGPQTGRAIDRYLRLRRSHVNAASPALWLGHAGKGLAYSGLYIALKRRADAAGIKGFHPHRLRHTGASRWLAAGGSEGGLMAVAGWSSRDMLSRYTEDTAMERAADESRRLALGDL
jgi:integrase